LFTRFGLPKKLTLLSGKTAVAAIPALKPNGKLIMITNNNDKDLIGSEKYKTVLNLLKIIGAKQFNHLILSLD
jgi:hypothetical protein